MIDRKLLGKLQFNISGTDNYICLQNVSVGETGKIYISMCGNHNRILIQNVRVAHSLDIVMGQAHPNLGPITKASFSIGGGSSIEGMRYIAYNSYTICTIGENCMISFDVTLRNSDAHPILDRETGKVQNWIRGISIGDHCWLGEKASILKNSVIPDHYIIGYNAVVSGNLKESYAAYAGNPARLVKTGINWAPNGAKCGFIANEGAKDFHG